MMKQKERNTNHASMQLLLRLVVRDEKGRIIRDTGQMPSRSYVIQFLEFFYAAFRFITSEYKATDVAGVESTYYWAYVYNLNLHFRFDAPINDSSYGIVVGSGDTAPTNTDNKLATQLTEGVGAGNITHNACTVNAIAAVVGANVDLVLLRSFTNNTGSVRTVKEAGIYVRCKINGAKYHCIIRDVLPSPVDVPDKCSLSVYYTMRTTV